MSTTTLKLPFKRFVAQVSTGAPRSKSSYLALMAENLAALQACPWREAAAVPASLTGHDFTAQTQFSDAYDAFKLTGNYDNQAMTEIAYAGMAAYRFTVPASAISGSVAVGSVSLPISRDRFEKSGVHLAVALSDSATPSTDWATVRGSGALAASSQLAQTEAANLMSGAPDEGTVTIDLSGVSSGNPSAYLWVYVTLEDYTDHWEMYNAKEKRLYAVEGSAMLAGDCAEVTFDGIVTADGDEVVLLSGGSSPTWLQPLPTINVGTEPPAIQPAPVNETFFTGELSVKQPVTNWFFAYLGTLQNGNTVTNGYNGMAVLKSTGDRLTGVTYFFKDGTRVDVPDSAISDNTYSYGTSEGSTNVTLNGSLLLEQTANGRATGSVSARISYSTTKYAYIDVAIPNWGEEVAVSSFVLSEDVRLRTGLTYQLRCYVGSPASGSGSFAVQGELILTVNGDELKSVTFLKANGTSVVVAANEIHGNAFAHTEGSGTSSFALWGYFCPARTSDAECCGTFGAFCKTGTNGTVYTVNGTVSFSKTAYQLGPVNRLMLKCEDAVPVEADLCTDESEESRRFVDYTIEQTEEENVWEVTADGLVFAATYHPTSESIALADSQQAPVAVWRTQYAGEDTRSIFDPSAKIRMEELPYGLAATVGDFSSAVATFEAGQQPSNAELLGRLVRTARKPAQGMMSLAPAAGALADELDALRPVPRFVRAATSPEGQTACQPGLSAWFFRPGTGSTVQESYDYRGGAVVSVVKVSDPVFLQLALLALRAPSPVRSRLVLTNTGESAVVNGFRLRFVAWASPGALWDASNAFALSAMGSMPSVYQSDGPGEVSWSVNCSGALVPFGTRAVSARRIGVSDVVDGDIAAGATIGIPLSIAVAEGDVVLIAPEVVGAATGLQSNASIYFGRQSSPSVSANNGAWARYPQDLGWFPRVAGE